jgi:hypothetical protein
VRRQQAGKEWMGTNHNKVKKLQKLNWAWWYMPVIPALERLRQEYCGL